MRKLIVTLLLICSLFACDDINDPSDDTSSNSNSTDNSQTTDGSGNTDGTTNAGDREGLRIAFFGATNDYADMSLSVAIGSREHGKSPQLPYSFTYNISDKKITATVVRLNAALTEVRCCIYMNGHRFHTKVFDASSATNYTHIFEQTVKAAYDLHKDDTKGTDYQEDLRTYANPNKTDTVYEEHINF